MRNFDRNSGFKNSSSSHYSRNSRNNDRDYSDYKPRNSSNKDFDRNDYKKPRRDYEPRQSYQDRTGSNRGNRSYDGGRSSLHDRSFRGNDHSRNERSFRNNSPPKRSRDRDGHSDTRHSASYRSNETRHRNMSPPSRRSDYKTSSTNIKSRLAPLRSRITGNPSRIARTGGAKILRRSDLRSGLVSKRSTTINRAKDYARKIRQARLKLNETTRSSSSSKLKSVVETKSPKKEAEEHPQRKNDETEGDFLAIANDVDFDEEDNESNDGSKHKEEKEEDSNVNKNDESKNVEKDKKTSEAGQSKDEKDEKVSLRDKQSTSRSRSPSKEKTRKFDRIEYSCIHCGKHSTSAQEYRSHLSGRRHLLAMREVGLRVRATLNRLRKVQRDKQLEIEARIKDVEDIQSKYCQVCKLNFRQSKEEHRESDDHKKISSFLKPYCKICRMKLISPMKYEIHRCHTDHIRRKLKAQEGSDDEINVQELDIGDFKTVDSVGNVDDEDIVDDDGNDQDMSNELLGKELIEKVEAYYCSICHDFIYNHADKEDNEKLIKDHCKARRHINRYSDFKKDEERKAKSKALKEAKKSPEKSTKQNGNDDKTEKIVKCEVDRDADINIDENTNEEHSEKNSKFHRYSESND